MFEIRHNGIPRSYRDKKETALAAAEFGKQRFKGDRIEVIDISRPPKNFSVPKRK